LFAKLQKKTITIACYKEKPLKDCEYIWFWWYKAMVYASQSYRLHDANLSFS